MKIIGLTGDIGSGKSTVAGFMAEMGAAVIDADRLGHQALQQADVRRKLTGAFGQRIIGPDGEISRRELGELVFGDAAALQKLNDITHPVMEAMAGEILGKYRRQEQAVVVIDAPLLIESGWDRLVDNVWVTTAPEAVILQRLRGRTGMIAAEARARIRTQLNPEDRASHADEIINTDCTMDELKDKVTHLWEKLKG